MTPKHRTVETAHGTIEYETVECRHCRESVVSNDAVPVVIGGEITSTYETMNEFRLEGADAEAVNLCPYCAESVFGFDQRSPGALGRRGFQHYQLKEWMLKLGAWGLLGVCFGFVLGVVLVVIVAA